MLSVVHPAGVFRHRECRWILRVWSARWRRLSRS